MTTPFAAYLEEGRNGLFIAALMDAKTKQWTVYTARQNVGGRVWKKHEFTGKKDDPFKYKNGALKYAEAIANGKQGEGFTLVWSNAKATAVKPDEIDGDHPDWWTAVCRNLNYYEKEASPVKTTAGTFKVKKPPGGHSLPKTADDDDDSPPLKRDLSALKEKMAAKTKVKVGSQEVAVKSKTAKPEPTPPQEEDRGIKPRFGYQPRK